MNLSKLTIQKIDQPKLKIKVYRVFENDLSESDDFYALTEEQKNQYLFVTIDQDKYFEANFDKDEIILYDTDKVTYESSVKFERESVGINYHSFLSDTLLSNEPNIKRYENNFIFSSYYNENFRLDNKVNIRYYLVVLKTFMQSQEPESVIQTIKMQGFTYRIDNQKVYYDTPGLLQLDIKKSKENNRLVEYNGRYYYILPALAFTGKNKNVRNEISKYCTKLGGTLMKIDTWQELLIANYLAQTFAVNNGNTSGYIYANIALSPYNSSKEKIFKTVLDIDSYDLDALKKQRLIRMNRNDTSDTPFLISANENEIAKIGYCNPNTNLPFIIEFDKYEFDKQSNALLKDLYENSKLFKFGNYSADGMPGADFCILPDNIKAREYQYKDGYLIGNYNRHCLLCFFTNQKFIGYNHSATFSSPANSHEIDDDCICMVVSAVDSEEIYQYDTLTFVIKLNTDQTHCGVPANVQIALVYNVFLPNQKILKQDLTFDVHSTNEHPVYWNNFAKGMAIKAIKTKDDIKLYRTGMRTTQDEFEKLDPDVSSPVISMTFAEIKSLTGIDFSEGYIGYGNISQAETFIKNIDIIAEDADIMDDLKQKSMEYIAGTSIQDVSLENNQTLPDNIIIPEEIFIQTAGAIAKGLWTSLSGTTTSYGNFINVFNRTPYRVNKNKIPEEDYNKKHYNLRLLKLQGSKSSLFKNYDTGTEILACCDDYPEMIAVGSIDKAFVINKLSSLYNKKLARDWFLFNSPGKDSISWTKGEDGYFYITIPNIFKHQDLYKDFIYDSRVHAIYYNTIQEEIESEQETDEPEYKELYDPIPEETISFDKYEEQESGIDVILFNGIALCRTSTSNENLTKFNIPSSDNVENLNEEVIEVEFEKLNSFYSNDNGYRDEEDSRVYFYDDNYNKDFITIKASTDRFSTEENINEATLDLHIQLAGYQHVTLPKSIRSKKYNFTIDYSSIYRQWSTRFHRYINLSTMPLVSFINHNNIFNNSLIRNETDDHIEFDAFALLGVEFNYYACYNDKEAFLTGNSSGGGGQIVITG